MSFEIARIRHSRCIGLLRLSPSWRTTIAVLFLTLLDPVAAQAVERAEDFVKGLQDRGYHDIALDYLESLKASPLANEATRKQVPYLRGVAMIEQSRHSTDPAARNRLLD